MNMKKSVNLIEIVIDEVALEGLDGITLEALWQRLALRLGDSLPLKIPFMEQIWKICLEISDFFFYELETPREKLIIFDLYELEFLNTDKNFEPKDIYPHCPVEDTKLNIKGSCSSYNTRTNIFDIVNSLSLLEVEEKYGQKLVIVASQTLREKSLIPDHVNPIIQLTLTHYCLLERIGRSRRIGEVTIKKSSKIKEDAKALFYIRKGLQDHGLIKKQVYFQGNTGSTYNRLNTGTLIHLTRFFNTRKPKVILWAEHLINYLKAKENYAAEYNEVKNELNLDYSFKKFFKINLLKNVFKTDVRVPYRSYYPNSVEKEWQIKSNSKERIIRLIVLSNPNIDINDIWRTEEVNDDEDHLQLFIQNQKINIPFLQQIYNAVEAKEFKGASQMELAGELGFTKLISRTLTRNLVRSKVVSTYLDDIGRQRTCKFVSKKFDEKSSLKKQLEEEISKIKEFSRSIQNEKTVENLSNNADKEIVLDNIEEKNILIVEKHNEMIKNISNDIGQQDILNNVKNKNIPNVTEQQNVQNDVKNEKETKALINKVNTLPKENITSDNSKDRIFNKVNNLFRKYKLSKNGKRYQCTSFTKCSKKLFDTSGKEGSNANIEEVNPSKESNNTILEKSTGDSHNGKIDINQNTDASTGTLALEELRKDTNCEEINQENLANEEICLNNKNETIVDSDFYKTIETKLVVQKPDCKKRSQKTAIVGFMENVHNSDDKLPSLSYRLLRRANLIIKTVKENKIIEDTQKLMKIISTEEDKEGLDAKIDKNSLIRLLQKLIKDNFIKNIKLTLKNKKQTIQKVINFICDTSIDINDSVIQSAVEQAKLKFCMMEANSRNVKVVESVHNSSLSNIVRHKKKPSEEKISIFYRDNSLGKKYGYSPKFIRMKNMHLFLYYLIYGHPEKVISKDILIENLRKEDSFCDELLSNDMNIYTNNISWKMFIPPLPKHRGYTLGWALMCDVLLRIPLSVFVKIHNVNFEVPGLQEFLDHPIKKHILVKDLPTSIRNLLFVKRKYMFSIHEIVMRLCYLGLVQFGPQQLKEKDQVFIFLNRHTELWDTTSSAAGYHKIEDKPYPVTKFTFTSLGIAENYWYELWNTCINTCLGGRSVVEGKDILLEDLSRKIEMIHAMKVKQSQEAVRDDTGFVPGDRKGAAGIDSAFFPHLKRNWNWVSTTQKDITKKEPRLISDKTTNTRTLNSQTRKTFQGKKRCNSRKQHQSKISVADPGKMMDTAKSHQRIPRELPLIVASGKPTKIIRKMLPRKPKRKRVKYDEIDFSALQRMDKLRVDWEQHEDNILLVCKVAMVYLCPNPRRNLVSFIAVRDILRSYSFSSYNKTSRACQRRLLYMLKQPKTVNSVLLGVEEIKQDYYINKRFGAHVNSIRSDKESPEDYEDRVEMVFKELVMYIAKKYYNISNMEQREPITVPKTIQEFNIFYKLKLPTKTITSPGVSKEVREVNDIHTATINSVIHSSMCCGKERRSWAYQLFKVYQQYPEYLLRNAMLKIRADQMVTMKKNYMCAYKKFGNCMPMSSSQYQLSSAYYYKFQTKWPYEVFSESYNVLYSLYENYIEKISNSIDGVEIKPGVGGIVAAIHDFVGTNNMAIDIEIPDQIIMLDPGLPEKDEVYQRIALRYQTILEGLSSDYNEHLKNNVNRCQFEDKSLQDDFNFMEHMNITNEQQSFVEIRSAKRPFKHDYCDSQPKKQKLDNEISQLALEKNCKLNDFEMEIIDKNIQPVIENSTEKSRLIESNESEVSLSLMERGNINNQMILCELVDVDCNNENVIPVIENVNVSIPSFPYESTNSNKCNEKDVSIVKKNDVNDHYIIEKSETSTVSANVSLPSVSCEALNINDHIKNKKDDNTGEMFSCISQKNNDVKRDSTRPTSDEYTFVDSTRNVIELNKVTITRVSDLLKKIGNPDLTKDVEARSDIHDVRTRQTRIAMLKMREELHDLTFHDSHHAHEYFVVNSFKLLCSLVASEEEKQNAINYQEMELPKKLFPVNIEMVNKVLDDVKKCAVFPKDSLSLDDFRKEVIEMKLFNWDHVNSVCKFIKAKAEFGATLHELVTRFNSLENELANILLLLSEKRMVLRAGIVAVRYIYHRYVNPWIIHSYKILRLEKESHQIVPEGSVYVLDNDDNTEDKDKNSNRVTTAANLFYNSSIESKISHNLKKNSSPQKESLGEIVVNDSEREENINEKEQSEMDIELQAHNDVSDGSKTVKEFNSQESKVENVGESDKSQTNQRRLRRNRTVLLKQKDIYRAAKLLDFSTAEEIKVVIKPWIRIDGVVNRRVLDRMLGAVLCYCIEKPGISLTAVQNRFTPAIQPYHTRELIEILAKLDCVNTTVQKVNTVTLFSKPAKLSLGGNPDLIADSDQIIIEPTLQATLRFGMFLSNRSYNLDFLSSL